MTDEVNTGGRDLASCYWAPGVEDPSAERTNFSARNPGGPGIGLHCQVRLVNIESGMANMHDPRETDDFIVSKKAINKDHQPSSNGHRSTGLLEERELAKGKPCSRTILGHGAQIGW
ncbi:MAG: hypothetical protein EA401_02375 [Planctomycetota bacterium]|nr:MAG: hypothetical protein EA401_02375 [Planctomycetota bacterium]